MLKWMLECPEPQWSLFSRDTAVYYNPKIKNIILPWKESINKHLKVVKGTQMIFWMEVSTDRLGTFSVDIVLWTLTFDLQRWGLRLRTRRAVWTPSGHPPLTQWGSSSSPWEISALRRVVFCFCLVFFFSNKPAFLCLLWENPQTPQRHWSLAGRGRQASPRRPGCHNRGRQSCSHWSRWPQGGQGGGKQQQSSGVVTGGGRLWVGALRRAGGVVCVVHRVSGNTGVMRRG